MSVEAPAEMREGVLDTARQVCGCARRLRMPVPPCDGVALAGEKAYPISNFGETASKVLIVAIMLRD